MIPRYTLPEMASIWEPENKFKIWLKVEVLACEALAKRGEIPKTALKDIQEKSDFRVEASFYTYFKGIKSLSGCIENPSLKV